MERFGHSADALTRTTEQLPTILSEQREAAIRQVFEGIATERTNLISSLAADEMKLRATLTELRQTLEAGSEMARSVGGAVQTLDSFMGRFDKGTHTPQPTVANSRPFDILDYATTAKEITATAKELTTTVGTLDQSLPRIQQAGAVFEQAGQRLLNRLFLLAIALIGFLISGIIAAVLVYRRTTRDAPILADNPAP